MNNKIKAIVKRPDELVGHMTEIPNTLESLQRTVNGYIETLSIGGSTVLIMNDEGKIRNLEPNFFIREHGYSDIICGTVVVVGSDGTDEFTDLPISLEAWTQMLKSWGNLV